MKCRFALLLSWALACHPAPSAPDPGPGLRFEKVVLNDGYYCDGITAADINRDGHLDVVAGPFWYAGPSLKQKQAFYPPNLFPTAVSPTDSMFSYAHDFNNDGWLDILVLGRVHLHAAYWYENPGPNLSTDPRPWQKHFAFHRIKGESPPFTDADGDGKPELTAHWENRWGFIRPNWAAPAEPWAFAPITAAGSYPQFYHGTGWGDVNGDGRPDLVLNEGWWEQPAAPSSTWTGHPFKFGGKGGAQMFVYDVDADGRSDIITSLDAHGWGLAWFRQNRDGTFEKRLMMGDRGEEERYGAAFTQPHALAMADMNGDGLQDVIVGKRLWAHGPSGDIEPNEKPVVYWFQLQRRPDPVFVPRLIDDASGVGVQITVADVNGDGRPDLLTASKLGAFAFLNRPGERP